MLRRILRKIFPSYNERYLSKLAPTVSLINNLERDISALSDIELRNKTARFKELLKNGESLDNILPEAFAVVREAARRTIGLRPFDVQILGAIVLHQGKIAEMKTGEGKTLVAVMPAYLNALTGKGVHIVTVNDYLAKRDSEWMGKIYNFLGLSVGCITTESSDAERKQAYKSDVTYGANNEFGFDYLRDNMKYSLEDMVQRELHYAIIDEVDSILIDEARTPLIISGPSEGASELCLLADSIARELQLGVHFGLDQKENAVFLTDEGIEKIENTLGLENLYDLKYMEILHRIHQALRAHYLFKKDVHYIVASGRVIIVDEFTGRLMPGRRYSDGLHQALEAKERVKIEEENRTLASITFQNYFRMYSKLAGMTGTAETEAEEFARIYGLDVIVIPTNKEMIRIDYPDRIYRTEREKFKAVIEEIKEMHAIGRPVLVGTTSIEKSELLSRMLAKEGIAHEVLNAKHHEKEAEIIAKAGQKGTVTIATNMAGRGTDIVLGEGVAEIGGLHIIGTERHESRRIDNQLRGRAGRQGDPGSSRFYLSLEDDLMKRFSPEVLRWVMNTAGCKEGEPLEHLSLSKALDNAQKRVEAHNFAIRKRLLEFDDVVNIHRTTIYNLRRQIITCETPRAFIEQMMSDVFEDVINLYCNEDLHYEEWEWNDLKKSYTELTGIHFGESFNIQDYAKTKEEVKSLLLRIASDVYDFRERQYTPEKMRQFERIALLQVIDAYWQNHLVSMDYLREGIWFRSFANEDPLIAFKREGFMLFEQMIKNIKIDSIKLVMRTELSPVDLENAAVL